MTWGDLESARRNLEAGSGMTKFVVGVGNMLSRDEGVGCHVVHALEGVPLRDVRIIDAGTCADALQLVRDTDKLVIVDAARGGGMPGQIYRFHPEDISLEEKPFLSLHDMSLLDNLVLMRAWHDIGETVIIGIEPKDIGWGLELSLEIQERMPQIVDAVLSEVNNTSPKGEVKC
jgi:hydrogenase maturation protease